MYLKYKKEFFLTTIFKVISSVLWIYVAIVIKDIIDTAISGDLNKFKQVAIYSILFFIVISVIFFIGDLIKSIYIKKTFIHLKNCVFEGIIRKDYIDFNMCNSAEYISNLTNDINLLENNYINPIMELTGEVVTFVLAIVVLARINLTITIVLICAGMILLLIPYISNKSLNVKQNDLSQNTALFTGKLKDVFDGYEVIKSYSIENTIIEEVKEYNNNLECSKQKFNVLVYLTKAFSFVLSLACQFSGMIIAGFLVISGELSIGLLMAIMQLSTGIFGPIQRIVQYITLIKGSKELKSKIFNLICEKSYKDDFDYEFKECIEFKNINFSYDGKKNALNNIWLKLEKNKKYAILGESGCGKTTLIKILLNYYNNYDGSIYIDNAKIEKNNENTISNLSSIIHQNVYMFDKSIKENIFLGKEFDKEHIQEVLTSSGVTKFFKNSKSNLKSRVGVNGSNVSGGQKQRIAIARAFIQDKPILILDEATSSLDKNTSMEIEESILDNPNVTVITITHNLNEDILKKYDKIFVMNCGTIVESGSFDELIHGTGYLSELNMERVM